jgi:class 3 adenylate cyclase
VHRKVVTVLFCDVVGSTSLGESVDPEALQELLARYFERMKGIVESHGGSVEKFIGDAVMAVFGVPQVREDDALRACRAAIEMRDALPQMGIHGRIGVNTGEVVTGTSERMATGDAVNVAARLEQAASADEVLIGETTHALVQSAVQVELVPPLELKGKAEPVPAFRLVSLLDAPARSHTTRFVGREGELALIADAWTRTQEELQCDLITVVGDAGVGKSRLVAEALATVDGRVVRGRCLPYGDGITYWPIVEVAKQLAALPSDPVAAAAIRSLLGESEIPVSGDEIAWAFRKLLEEQSPLVVVLDDVQWGDETFLDLLESTALLSTGAPLLLLCMARPELVERRPAWPGTVRLEPLSAEHANELIGDTVSEDLRERIAHAAGGNPLFLTEMLAMAAVDDQVDVPPTLRALLAARLDQLEEPERRVLERGSVEGEIFHRGAVQALVPEETQVTTRLAALVRHQLVRPDRAQLAGEDGYRFRHLLIRDAAYDALPKAVRADLHARFADWLDEHGQALVERDEIVGYHLEQAARYHAELGRPEPALADRASARLAAAGRRAFDRLETRTASALLSRAAELVRPHRFDLTLELEAAWSLGEEDSLATAALADAAGQQAEAEGDRSGAKLSRALALFLRTAGGDHPTTDEQEELLRAALPLEEERGDPRRLAILWDVLASIGNFRMQNEDDVNASMRALHYRRLAGDSPLDSQYEWPLIIGPRPANEALRTIAELETWRAPGATDLPRAVFLAMDGRFDEAWPLAEARADRLREISGVAFYSSLYLWIIATIEGDRDRATRHAGELVEVVGTTTSVGATFTTMFARELCYLGRFEEAEPLARRARAVPPRASMRVMGPTVEALFLAEQNELEEAVILARMGVAKAESEIDSIFFQGWAYEDLVTVLLRAGRTDEACEALTRLLTLWERKGCLPCAQRVRDQIASLGRETM